MCGISGIINFSHINSKTINTIHSSLKNRGPDDYGKFVDLDNRVFLFMTRLAIIGIKEGTQPKINSNKSVVLIFNGEIFNYQELNKKFFNNENIKSDTEIIIRLYEKFGLDMIKLLNGMFAISIYDKLKKKIFLIRDRFGIKPLYFYSQDKFIFSSEINTFEILEKSQALDNISINNYISLGYNQGDNTIYKNIKKLNPGSILTYNLNNKSYNIKKWYTFKKKEIRNLNFNEVILRIENQLIKTLKLWSKSDVPISFLLSGGLDSGILASLYSTISKDFSTFSYGFREKKFERWNELVKINQLAEQKKLNHFNFFFSIKDFENEFHKLISVLGEPYGGGLPAWFLLKKIKTKSKVVLSGTGGDELFGNYNRYFNYNNIYGHKINFKNFQNGYFFNNNYPANRNWQKRYLVNQNFDADNKFYGIFKKNKLGTFSKNLSFLDIQTQLVDEFLYISDKFSMAHSIELRTPYLDHELVELVYGLKENFRISKKIYKPILYNLGHKYLTSKYLTNDKKGFSIPLSYIMRNNLRELVSNTLSKKNISKWCIVKNIFYDDYVKPMFNGNNKNIQLIWNIFVLHYWLENKKI